MSLARHTVKPLLVGVAVALGALPLAACGRDEPDLSNGKALFVQLLSDAMPGSVSTNHTEQPHITP